MSIYLDNAATSYPKPEGVFQAVRDYMQEVGVNPGRGAYRRALKAEQEIFNVRKRLADLFNIEDVSRIVFTSNVTEALNLALKGILSEGDHVITTRQEHNAVWRPLKRLERERGIKISRFGNPVSAEMDLEELESSFRPETALVVINHASNVTGAIMPAAEIGSICRQKGIPLLMDSAQTAGALPVDVQADNISLLGFTGHKSLLGPTGTGGLYIEPGLDLRPLKEGGTGSKSYLERQPEDLPDRFEAGTLNAAGLAGLAAGVEYLENRGLNDIRRHEVELTEKLMEGLEKLKKCEIYGPSAREKVGVTPFNLDNIPPEEAAGVLDEVHDIMVRAGLHCSPQAHKELGTENRGSIRVSVGPFNDPKDIEKLLTGLKQLETKAGRP